jgi:hypothetical protein
MSNSLGLWIAYLVLAWLLFGEANQQNPGREDGPRTLQYARDLSIIYGICILFLKASLLLQIIELFAQLQDLFYWSCHCASLVTFCFCVAVSCLKLIDRTTSSVSGYSPPMRTDCGPRNTSEAVVPHSLPRHAGLLFAYLRS